MHNTLKDIKSSSKITKPKDVLKTSNNGSKPFLKWAGGKTQLIKDISNTIPNKVYKWDSFTYIEPFVGSGAVLFWMINNFPSNKLTV